ncbi:MAG: cytochrome c [Rhodobacteraceae bacterium]|nr:cytochrome c [Paracoccaceae bacterium]
MKTTCKLCWGTNVLMIGVIAFAAYTFIFGKTGEVGDDGRTAVMISADEKELVLGEMRGLLEAVQAITGGLAENDLATVAESAHAVGMSSTGGEPAALIAKLPLEFKKLGMGTHQAFDDLGNEATDMGDAKVVLGMLGDVLQNCTACHASYRFDVEQGGS